MTKCPNCNFNLDVTLTLSAEQTVPPVVSKPEPVPADAAQQAADATAAVAAGAIPLGGGGDPIPVLQAAAAGTPATSPDATGDSTSTPAASTTSDAASADASAPAAVTEPLDVLKQHNGPQVTAALGCQCDNCKGFWARHPDMASALAEALAADEAAGLGEEQAAAATV